MRGFLASSLRDAPYAGLFTVLYEAIKHEASKSMNSRLSRFSVMKGVMTQHPWHQMYIHQPFTVFPPDSLAGWRR